MVQGQVEVDVEVQDQVTIHEKQRPFMPSPTRQQNRAALAPQRSSLIKLARSMCVVGNRLYAACARLRSVDKWHMRAS